MQLLYCINTKKWKGIGHTEAECRTKEREQGDKKKEVKTTKKKKKKEQDSSDESDGSYHDQ